MTVIELIEILDRCDPDAHVRLAMQPSWPMQHEINGIVTPDDIDDPDGEAWAEPAEPATIDLHGREPIVYLTDGGQVYNAPYLPDNVARAAW